MRYRATRARMILSLLVVMASAGCQESILDVLPPASLTGDDFFKSADDAEQAVTSAYAALRDLNNYAKLTEAPIDDNLIFNTSGTNLEGWFVVTTDGIVDAAWQALYESIFRANLVLQHVPAIEMNEAQKQRILGEAHFLRALYYWRLTSLFGEVPLVTEADPSDVSKAMLPKSPVADIYAVMIDDLEQAIDMLPWQSEYSAAEVGRASKGAALGYLGKVYLYAGDFPMAESYFQQVIDSGEYQLLDDFSDLLITDNNAETLFEVQLADLPGQTSSRMHNDYPQGQGGFANLLPTQSIVDEFEEHSGPTAINGRDPRLFHSIFQDGDPYDDVSPFFDADWTPTGYARKKGTYPVVRFNPTSAARNIPFMRFADVLLMYAESLNENSKPAEAIAAINRVRERVGMPDLPTAQYPVGSKQEIFDAIVHERRVELAFEYHRLHDLRRWGLAEEALGDLGYVEPRHRYYPIPQGEIDNNPNLVQNPNY